MPPRSGAPTLGGTIQHHPAPADNAPQAKTRRTSAGAAGETRVRLSLGLLISANIPYSVHRHIEKDASLTPALHQPYIPQTIALYYRPPPFIAPRIPPLWTNNALTGINPDAHAQRTAQRVPASGPQTCLAISFLLSQPTGPHKYSLRLGAVNIRICRESRVRASTEARSVQKGWHNGR